MMENTLQEVLDKYKEENVITSKQHNCLYASILEQTSERGRLEQALYSIHVIDLPSFFSKNLESLENIPAVDNIDKSVTQRIFLHQFVNRVGFLHISRRGHNLYLHALFHENNDLKQQLETRYQADFTLFENPLHLAVECCLLEMVKSLVNDKGIDVNCVDSEGNTPLHWLMKQQLTFDDQRANPEKVNRIFEFLKGKGAKVMAKNRKGHSPLQYAVIYKTPDVDQLINMCQDFTDFNTEAHIEVLELTAALYMTQEPEQVDLYEKGVGTLKSAFSYRKHYDIPNTGKMPPRELFFNVVEPDTDTEQDWDDLCQPGFDGIKARLILSLLIFERILGCEHLCFLRGCLKYIKLLREEHEQGKVTDYQFLNVLQCYCKFVRKEKVLKNDLCSVDNHVNKHFDLSYFYTHRKRFSTDFLLSVLSSVFVGVFQMKIDQGHWPDDDNLADLMYFLDAIMSRNLSTDNRASLTQSLTEIVKAWNSAPRSTSNGYDSESDDEPSKYSGLVNCIVSLMQDDFPERAFLDEDREFDHGPEVLELFLDCGALINEVSDEGNILHCFFSDYFYNGPLLGSDINREAQRRRIVQIALERGIHVDQVGGYQGKTVLEMAIGTKFYRTLKNPKYRSLKCLATSVIIKNNISFRQDVPPELIQWIDFHRGVGEI